MKPKRQKLPLDFTKSNTLSFSSLFSCAQHWAMGGSWSALLLSLAISISFLQESRESLIIDWDKLDVPARSSCDSIPRSNIFEPSKKVFSSGKQSSILSTLPHLYYCSLFSVESILQMYNWSMFLILCSVSLSLLDPQWCNVMFLAGRAFPLKSGFLAM